MTTLDALDASAPTLLQTLRGHAGEVTCADACGARLVSGGGDRALRAWRWERGGGWSQHAVAKQAHRYGVTAARWSPGGVLIASGGVDGAVRIWCGRTLTARRLLAAPGAAAVRALCWAGAGRTVAGHDDGAACIWDVLRGVMLARLQAHQGALHALATPARGALLLAACTEGVLKVFDLQAVCRNAEEGSPPPSPLAWVDSAHDMGALCADTSADGTCVATGGHDARVRLWRVTSGATRGLEPGATLEGHAAAITALRWGFGRRGILASGSLDRTARLWAARAGACLCVLHAHARYLTCVVLAPDQRYLLTGSNDKSLRMWSLGALTLDDELEPPCIAHAHFGVGDLQGIGPVDSEDLLELEAESPGPLKGPSDEASGGGAHLQWRSADAHDGAINCISIYEDLLATASSDGIVRIFRWNATENTLELEHQLGERGYPVLGVDFGASGALLLSGGLEGTAQLWDVKSGCLLRALSPPSAAEADTGGGGVRSARVGPQRPPLLLLATDDGVLPLWSLADPDPKPIHVYSGHPEAAVCCAWSGDGRMVAAGGAEGELRLYAAAPAQGLLLHQAEGHDLGVQSCDFAPTPVGAGSSEDEERQYVLATGGSDGLIKLWLIEVTEDLTGTQASMRLLRQVEAHGGGVACVRWGAQADESGALLCSGGADRWARVWRVRGAGVRAVGAVPASCAGGATATALLDSGTLAIGTLSGELSLWALPLEAEAEAEPSDEAEEDSEGEAEADADAGAAPRWWRAGGGVARWLRQHVTRVPGSTMSREHEAALLQRARDEDITGSRLLDDPIDELLDRLGCAVDDEVVEEENPDGSAALRERLTQELNWLRRDSPPPELAWAAPHALLCPLSHRVLCAPVRAADGCTYERVSLHEWFLAADGAVSGVSGRGLRNARVLPNHRAAAALHTFLQQHQHEPEPDS